MSFCCSGAKPSSATKLMPSLPPMPNRISFTVWSLAWTDTVLSSRADMRPCSLRASNRNPCLVIFLPNVSGTYGVAWIISSASRMSLRGGRPRLFSSFQMSLIDGFIPVCFESMERMRSSMACSRRIVFCVATHSLIRRSVLSSGYCCSNSPTSASASSHLPRSVRLKIDASSLS